MGKMVRENGHVTARLLFGSATESSERISGGHVFREAG
jgi:hypothetical protein